MFAVLNLLKQAGGVVFNAPRWFVAEFVPLARGNTVSARITDLCRLLGLGSIVGIMAFETRGLALLDVQRFWPVWLLDGVLAILIGNIVREVAIWLGVRIVNAFGAGFYRRGMMLDGTPFTEVFHPDGTWRRCEYPDGETICEWTDRFGACHRSVTRARSSVV